MTTFNTRLTWIVGLKTKDGVALVQSDVVRGIANILNIQSFDSFNVTKGKGYWQGVPENCLTVTLLDQTRRDLAAYNGKHIAKLFTLAFDQTAVLYLVEPVTAGLASASDD